MIVCSSQRAEIMERSFKCNMLSCTARVWQQVCFSVCGHVFCVEHGKEWFAAHDTCPVCDVTTEVRLADFGRSRETALVGCTPDDMMRAVSAGMLFWEQQRSLERQQLEAREKANLKFFQEKLLQAEAVVKDLMGAFNQTKGYSPSANEVQPTPPSFDPPSNSKRLPFTPN